jgi:hypothetical protein
MRSVLFAILLTTGAAHAASPLTPIQCAMTADTLYVLINGQQIPVAEWMRPMLLKAADHFRASSNKDAYWHSTRLLLECLRTGGNAAEMYDPRRMADPDKVQRTT